jgi:FkbM family methyltransferase
MKQFAKTLMALTPYRIIRNRGANRFQAIEVCLHSMKERGFLPNVVVDGGAHVGAFSLAAKKIFPAARFHLVEPQPACARPLRAVCASEGFVLHECALANHVGEVRLTPSAEPNTGVHVEPDGGYGTVSVRASTLDTLFGNLITSAHRALLKMDLQGYELHALRGGSRVLPSVEVILTEVSFFACAYEPPIAVLIAFLDASGFQLYDVAALAGRTRDNRLHQGDLLFVRKGSPLLEDSRWH